MAESDPACNTCAKKASDEVTLKRCAKCKTQWYCSRECQKTDWKAHKKTCSKDASEANTGDNSRRTPKGLSAFIAKPLHELDKETWLHNRPEEDVYKLLIDAYRLHLEDQYVFDGDADVDSIYGGQPDSRDGFHRFLRLAERKRGLLPSWWSPEKAKECLATGLRGGWSSLANAVEKGDIIEHYGDHQMPMQMRMLSEQICGRGPGGQPGAEMRKIMMQTETGDMYTSFLDASSFLRRA
ncbi:zinc finger MYND domain-containing protein [Aspergillus mulundensis]|uniref:MYND finger n=1 Tax=Aspergillus mulundensis TaxID=1810919 RepID=A0A3D8T4F5_9EURO|nr:MYND finger [Aspergillus mulundensis]RDW93341.1 MYND finger [Aspergillus mulundensis]